MLQTEIGSRSDKHQEMRKQEQKGSRGFAFCSVGYKTQEGILRNYIIMYYSQTRTALLVFFQAIFPKE